MVDSLDFGYIFNQSDVNKEIPLDQEVQSLGYINLNFDKYYIKTSIIEKNIYETYDNIA